MGYANVYETAICFKHGVDYSTGQNVPLKYRNIKNRWTLERFLRKKNIAYINYYNKASKAFVEKVYL